MDELNRVWRSWFWNIVSATLILVVTVMVTITAVVAEPLAANVIYGAMAAVLWIGVFRTLFLRVAAKPHGIVMRGVTHTTTIPWSEVLEITGDQTSGASGALGASTAVVIRKGKTERETKEVRLNVLGSYGLGRNPTLADRAVAGLNECHAMWKESDRQTK